MKKCLAVLLALVLTLSFLTFTVSAADMEITPYAFACSSCRNAMERGERYFTEGHFKVQSCPIVDGVHLHLERYVQAYWVCKTAGCPARLLEINAGNPVYVGDVCGHLE